MEGLLRDTNVDFKELIVQWREVKGDVQEMIK